MTEIAVFAQLRAHPGRGDELLDAVRALADVASQQPATHIYAVHRAHEDPDAVWIYELHADQAALEDNAGHEAAIQIGPQMLDLLAEPPTLTFCRPAFGKGLPGSEPPPR